MPMTVVPFTADHLEPAASLLAARHQADQGRLCGLPANFGDPTVALSALEALLHTPWSSDLPAGPRGPGIYDAGEPQ